MHGNSLSESPIKIRYAIQAIRGHVAFVACRDAGLTMLLLLAEDRCQLTEIVDELVGQNTPSSMSQELREVMRDRQGSIVSPHPHSV